MIVTWLVVRKIHEVFEWRQTKKIKIKKSKELMVEQEKLCFWFDGCKINEYKNYREKKRKKCSL